MSMGMQLCLLEERFKGKFVLYRRIQPLSIITGQPVDDLPKFRFRPAFPGYFLKIQRIDRRESHRGDALTLFLVLLHKLR
jgi:hypothetical protein